MKTLREYIDQLDEISRRDFLKGAGATAGLAALGTPNFAKAQRIDADDKTTNEKIVAMLYLYHACKNPYANPKFQVPASICQQCNSLIQKFIKAYPNGKSILNEWYRSMYDYEQSEYLSKGMIGPAMGAAYTSPEIQRKTLRDFATLLEFLGSNTGKAPTDQQLASVRQAMAMEEESLEETSEDPIAKIDALFKDKR